MSDSVQVRKTKKSQTSGKENCSTTEANARTKVVIAPSSLPNMTTGNNNDNPPHNTNPPGGAAAAAGVGAGANSAAKDFVEGWTMAQTLGEGAYGE